MHVFCRSTGGDGISPEVNCGVLEVANDQGGLRANTAADGILLLDQTGWADIHGEARGAFGAMIRHFVACLRFDAVPAGTTPDEALTSMRVARRLVDDAAARHTPPAAPPRTPRAPAVSGVRWPPRGPDR